MKNRILFSFLTLGASLFADRSQDIDTILKTSFSPETAQGKMLVQMQAGALLQESEKTMDPDKLIDRFFEEMNLSNYHQPFEIFTDEELKSIASMYTNPAYIKLMNEGQQVYGTVIQRMSENLKTIIERDGTQKSEPISAKSDFEIVDLTKDNFFEKVLMAKTPMIIDFSGKQCGPCHLLAPVFEELNAEFGEKISFIRIECTDVPEIAQHFNVRGIPTLLFLKPNGAFPEVIKSKVGFKGKEDLREEIVQFLKGIEK